MKRKKVLQSPRWLMEGSLSYSFKKEYNESNTLIKKVAPYFVVWFAVILGSAYLYVDKYPEIHEKIVGFVTAAMTVAVAVAVAYYCCSKKYQQSFLESILPGHDRYEEAQELLQRP